MSYKYQSSWNKKTSNHCFLKILSFLLITFGIFIWAFCKVAPQTAQNAKDEALYTIFGIEQDTIRVGKDSTKVIVKPKTVQKKPDATAIAKNNAKYEIPVEIDDDKSIYIKANVNGVPMKFLLDTGCSGIQITAAEYYYMLHNGAISENDRGSDAVATIADGSSYKVATAKLKSVNIGGHEIKDVGCDIEENTNAPLLMGQSVLSKLGKITIDYNSKKIIVH